MRKIAIYGKGDCCYSVVMNQLSEKMAKHFGCKPHAVLCLETSLEKISTMSKAKVNLVISYEGLEGAKLLQERFGTPYVYGFPLTSARELEFLEKISAFLPVEEGFSQGNPPEIPENYKKLAVYAPYDVLRAMADFAQETGLEIQFLLCSHSLKEVEHPLETVRDCKTEKEKIALFQSLEHTLVLGEDTFFSHVEESNRCVSLSRQSEGLSQILGGKNLFS